MATDDRPPAAGAGTAQQCMACRGTGRVISNLGGSASEVLCPWCDGTGRFIADHDAQAQRRSTG